MPTMVEHVVAEQLWASDPEGTRWRGGNNPGYDVIGSGERVDAKTAWYGTGVLAGRLCFAAPEQFDADRVQAVAPVVLVNARLAWAAQPGGGGRIVGAYDDAEMWKIPVTLVNRLMQRHSKAKSSILLKDIAQYKVNRHRGHVPPPE